MTNFRFFLIGLAVLFAGFVAVEYYKPEPTDWRPTYQNHDKIPYGTYVLYDLLPELFGRQRVSTVRQPIANQLLPNLGTQEDPDTVLPASSPAARVLRTPANYLFVHRTFELSRLDRDALLRYVAHGNHAFIATEYLDELLTDTLRLHLATSNEYAARQARRRAAGASQATGVDSTTLRLLNAGFAAHARFRFPASEVNWYIEPDSACQATALAVNARRQPVLVRVPYGQGFLYLCSTPAALSNYFLLRPATAGFGFAALSYLPPRPVFWDEYQKQGRLGEQSLWRVVRQHAALRWAVGLLAIGLGLFALFEAKRRQRIIPVIKPLPNTTLLFTRTVAALYWQKGNHALIAEKKIGLFLEYLRTRFQEPALDLNDAALRERLAQKAGVTSSRLDSLIRIINLTRTAPRVSAQDLLLLNQALNTFRNDAR